MRARCRIGRAECGVRVLVIGCGNPLCGDDGAGPELVRRLGALGLPDGVECLDSGTDGMAVAFRMRGAEDVILVDACRAEGEPGRFARLAGEALERLPPVEAINLHAFRWDHALAFARWLLGDDYPRSVVVWLVEGADFEPGSGLSPEVDRAVDRLAERIHGLILRRHGDGAPPCGPGPPPAVS